MLKIFRKIYVENLQELLTYFLNGYFFLVIDLNHLINDSSCFLSDNRILVEQLAKVNPIHLNCNERLAFWINLYNALIMHVSSSYLVECEV